MENFKSNDHLKKYFAQLYLHLPQWVRDLVIDSMRQMPLEMRLVKIYAEEQHRRLSILWPDKLAAYPDVLKKFDCTKEWQALMDLRVGDVAFINPQFPPGLGYRAKQHHMYLTAAPSDFAEDMRNMLHVFQPLEIWLQHRNRLYDLDTDPEAQFASDFYDFLFVDSNYHRLLIQRFVINPECNVHHIAQMSQLKKARLIVHLDPVLGGERSVFKQFGDDYMAMFHAMIIYPDLHVWDGYNMDHADEDDDDMVGEFAPLPKIVLADQDRTWALKHGYAWRHYKGFVSDSFFPEVPYTVAINDAFQFGHRGGTQ